MSDQQSAVDDATTPHHEFIVVGAGLCGVYQLIRLQQLGVDVLVLEAHEDLGGTWFKNRYPGCRFDSESFTYGYSFSDDVLQEWSWTERFASQPETLRYLNFVADKFDLRSRIHFDSRVRAASFDDTTNTWTVTVEDGRIYTCRFLVSALGLLSAPTSPNFAGLESFRGMVFHSYDWPDEGLDLAGKRVAVFGTGSTGVQIISTIVDQVAELTVYQRRPSWCAPLHNTTISDSEMTEIKASYRDIFAKCASTPGGFIHGPDPRRFADVAPEERRAFWEKLYDSPGFGIWLGNFREVLTDDGANAELSGFIAEKIRERIHDPAVAEKLVPKDHGFGVQRVAMETRYYEAYNRENVRLVDLLETPVDLITPTGIRTSDGTRDVEIDVDVIIFATGFDAITGSFDRIDITGSNGVRLRDKWRDGPTTYLGVQVAGFPNLVMLAGPHAASVATNFPRAIESAVDWATDLFAYALGLGYTRVETTPEAEAKWEEHVKDMYGRILLRKAKSWFTGYNTNVPDHDKVRYLIYTGGAPRYRRKLAEATSNDYEGFCFG